MSFRKTSTEGEDESVDLDGKTPCGINTYETGKS